MQWENDDGDERKIASAPPIYPNLTNMDHNTFRIQNINKLQRYLESEEENYKRCRKKYEGFVRTDQGRTSLNILRLCYWRSRYRISGFTSSLTSRNYLFWNLSRLGWGKYFFGCWSKGMSKEGRKTCSIIYAGL